MNGGPPGSSVQEIFQERILEWVIISFSRGSSNPGIETGLLHCRQILYWLSYQGSLILYIENPEDSTRKFLQLINEYGKLAGYKINTQKSLTFLYTNNEKAEREIKETIPFTIATKINK